MGHGKLDVEKFVREGEAIVARMGDKKWLKLKEGDNLIRILPPWEDSGTSVAVIWGIHYQVGPKSRSVPCLAKMHSKPCRICDYLREIEKRTNELSKEEKQMVVKERFALNVVDLNNPDLGVQILVTGPQIFNGIWRIIKNPEWGDITDPEKGYDLTITRDDSGKFTEYTVFPKKNPTPLPREGLTKALYDLSKIYRIYSYEEQGAILEHGEIPEQFSASPSQETTAKPEDLPAAPVQESKEEPLPELPEFGQKTEGKKLPKCLGKHNPEDAFCKTCESAKECIQMAQKKPEAPKPKCFAKGYDDGDPECKACESLSECKAATEARK